MIVTKKTHWKIKDAPNHQQIKRGMETLNIERIPATLLAQRGITDFGAAKAFFRPDLSHLHNPFLMKGMDVAVKRLQKAATSGENILIYGDYDVDGSTAVALMYSIIRSFHENVAFYIPDRYQEGYGVSDQGIDFAIDNDFQLIITLDCGIKAVEKIKRVRNSGIDVIICDHHTPGETLPPALAVLDPKQEDCTYPYDELCGCGVGFKLLQGFFEKQGWDNSPLLQKLDLVATAIAADIVPMTGENRVLMHYGLQQLNQNPSPGMAELMKITGLKRKFSVSDVVFYLAPRINAAGRMGHAEDAVNLLISNNEETACEKAEFLNQQNITRKDLDSAITEAALEQVCKEQRFTSVLYHPDWHKGVIGIVASRVIEHYYRPTVVLTKSNGVLTGSVRSVKGINVYKALEMCQEHLEQFGGHKYAAGVTLKPENLDSFTEEFEIAVAHLAEGIYPEKELVADVEWKLSDVSQRSYNIIKQMEPFGPGNMRPVFYASNVVPADSPRIIGNSHLKMKLCHLGDNNKSLNAIWWGEAQQIELINSGKPLEIVYVVEENFWNGNKSLQLIIRGLREMNEENDLQ